jgi:O-antigen/teichoic acid export membrane protein
MTRPGNLFRFLNRTGGSVAEKTARSVAWVGASSLLTNLLHFISQIFVARLLVPDQIGLMGIALFFLRVLDVLSQPGLSAAIIHRTERIREAVDAAWSALILRGVVLAGLTFLIAPLVAGFYGQPELTKIIRVISTIYVIQGLSNSYLILLRKDLDFKWVTMSGVAATLAQFVAVVTVAFIYRSVWALVAGQIVLAAVRTATSFLITRERPSFQFHWSMIRELFRYGKFVTGTTIVSFLTTGIDKAVSGKILGMAPLGYYVYAQSLASLPANNSVPMLQRVLFPALSKLQSRLPELRGFYLRVLRLVVALTLPASAGIAVLAVEIVGTVYGEAWLPMVGALYVLCAFCVVRVIAQATQPVFLALGKPQIGFYLAAAKLALIVALIYPLSMRYGIAGTALSVTAPALLEQLLLWTLAAGVLHCSVVRIVGVLWRPAAAAALMALAVWVVKGALTGLAPVASLVVCVVTGALVYLGAMAVLDRGLLGDVRKLTGAWSGSTD